MASSISFSNYRYIYPGAERPALDIEALNISAGEFCCLVGPNAAGKSTLCRVLSGLIPHFFRGEIEGSVHVLGEDAQAKSVHELAGVVGYIMDDPFDQLTRATYSVYDEIAFGLQNVGMPVDEIRLRVSQVLEELQITDLADRLPTQLSGGQQQRVAIASIFARRPEILVMDEATSQLDPMGCAAIYTLVKHLKDTGKTVLMVESKLDHILKYADRILVMEAGQVVASGSPRQVLAEGHFERLNLGLPSYPALAKELSARGLVGDVLPIHLDEACQMIQEVLGGDHRD
jgi:energy-coupling factor transporter ATP-binding protein EcfA2